MGEIGHNVFGNPIEEPAERDLGPRMAVLDNLAQIIFEGKAEIVSKQEVPPINGRKMFRITVAINDGH